jgi:hypothetical protein
MRHRQPMNSGVQGALIMLVSGLVAAVLCTKVYGANLPAADTETRSRPPALASLPQTAGPPGSDCRHRHSSYRSNGPQGPNLLGRRNHTTGD